MRWLWKGAQETAFNELKKAISNPPVLKTPDYSKGFNIASDASGTGIRGVVSQIDETGKERPIANFSRQLNQQEKNWSIYEQETLALAESLKKFRHYVEGNKVNLFTDHKALIYLNNQPKLTAKQARWVSYLNLFNYTIKYREGASNKVADGLSRQYAGTESLQKDPERLRLNSLEELPICRIDFNLNYLEEERATQTARSRLRLELACMCMKQSTVGTTLLDEIREAQQQDGQCIRVLKN